MSADRAAALRRLARTHRWTAGVVLTFLAVLGTWVIGMPRYAGPDEPSHTIKAFAAAHGEMLGVPMPGRSPLNRAMLAPADLIAPGACFAFHPEVTASCGTPVSDPSLLRLESTSATYPLPYYALVGGVTRVLGVDHSLRSYRLVSVIVTSVALGLAAALLARLGRGRPAFILLALTPMAVFVCSTVNPTAFEISGMILLWSYLATWLFASAPPGRRQWLAASALSAALVVVRPVSMPWVAVAIGAYLVLEQRPLAPDRAARARLLAVSMLPLLVAVVASIAWSRYAHVGLSDDKFVLPGSTIDHLRIAIGHTGEMFDQLIGVLGWVDTTLPFPVMASGVLLLVGVVLATLRFGDRRLRIVVLSLLAVWLVYPVVYTTLARTPLNWQGRYNLPLLGGLVLCAVLLSRQRVDEAAVHRVVRVVGALFVIGEVLAYHQALRRFMVGASGDILLRNPSWHPDVSVWLLICVNVVATVGLTELLRRSPTVGVR